MTPPLTCPPPQDPDCPLYSERMTERSPAETLRRLILTERCATPDLGDLMRAERLPSDPPRAALPPGPPSGTLSILDQLKEKADAESTRPPK